MRAFPLTSLTAALLCAAASAQTGPWTDGELIVSSTILTSGSLTIYRVVPETGATAPLVSPLYLGGWSGMLAFDSFRGGLLANVSLPPDSWAMYRLWLISHDGTAAAMPGFTGSLRALCPTGDGRVFFLRHFGGGQGPTTVEYYDAANQLKTLKAADGVTDFEIEVEHLLYDASSNALIGSSSNWWSATDCSAVGASVYRIPLSADGLRVGGAVTCASVTDLAANEDIMSLDHLPNGEVLVTAASGSFPSTSKLISVDPVTLAHSTWADPLQADFDGGVWSARIGKAVLHTGGELRAFTNGATDAGGLIATSMPIPGWGGFSPADDMIETDLNGPGCLGFQVPYGAGLAGKAGHVPLLGVVGCPDIGEAFTISINSVVGGAPGVLAVSFSSGSTPLAGGTLLLGPIAFQLPMFVGGTAGAAGAGSKAIPVTLIDTSLAGIDFYMQAGFVDAAAVQGISMTNGVRFQGL